MLRRATERCHGTRRFPRVGAVAPFVAGWSVSIMLAGCGGNASKPEAALPEYLTTPQAARALLSRLRTPRGFAKTSQCLVETSAGNYAVCFVRDHALELTQARFETLITQAGLRPVHASLHCAPRHPGRGLAYSHQGCGGLAEYGPTRFVIASRTLLHVQNASKADAWETHRYKHDGTWFQATDLGTAPHV